MVAVELALILIAIGFILAATFTFGQIFWKYNVLKNATNTAARYIAAGSWAEIKNESRQNAARLIVAKAVEEAGITGSVSFLVVCLPAGFCTSSTKPSTIFVAAMVQIDDMNGMWFPDGFSVASNTTVSYTN